MFKAVSFSSHLGISVV